MPNVWHNWTFEDVDEFLKLHGFVRHMPLRTSGSHFWWLNPSDAEAYVEFQRHGKGTYPPRTVKSNAERSKIPLKEWLEFSKDKVSYRRKTRRLQRQDEDAA